MGNILQQQEYAKDIELCASDMLVPWQELQGKTVLISGATGMIASVLIDIIMYRNKWYGDDIRVIAVSRNADRAKERFGAYWEEKRYFSYISHDISMPLSQDGLHADYVIHAASNTHPRAYATDPIGTITTNVDGTRQLLELARKCASRRFVFISSVEIYGENRGDKDKFDEGYLGYIDCNTMRAGYPESKRLGETLCSAYEAAYGTEFVITRLSRVYGPTLLADDSKALSQFIYKAAAQEDIVLKSEGNQRYSYTYVTDVVMGVLAAMLLGEKSHAYNVSDKDSDITLKEAARILAQIAGKQVVFDLPDAVERAGYSKATKALLDSSALEQLGWRAKVHMQEGLERTVKMLRGMADCQE